MREYGIPKLLTWRWTPFAALVLGSLSFIGFAMLVIPDRIGNASTSGSDNAASLNLGSTGLSANLRTQAGSKPGSNWSNDDHAGDDQAPSPVANAATRGGDFPRRGFSPPLERPNPPPQVFQQPPPGQAFTPAPNVMPPTPPPAPPPPAAFTAPLPTQPTPEAAAPPPPVPPPAPPDPPVAAPSPGSVMPTPN